MLVLSDKAGTYSQDPAELLESLLQAAADDPAGLAPYPNGLALELVLNKDMPLADILSAYELTPVEFKRILSNPNFRSEYEAATEAIKAEGWSFKQKARAQAEALLPHAWKLATSPQTPSNVRLETIRSVVKWAQLEAPAGAQSSPGGQTAVIVNIGGEITGGQAQQVKVTAETLQRVQAMDDEAIERAALSIIARENPTEYTGPKQVRAQQRSIIDVQAEKLMQSYEANDETPEGE